MRVDRGEMWTPAKKRKWVEVGDNRVEDEHGKVWNNGDVKDAGVKDAGQSI